MALDKTTLQASILSILSDMETRNEDAKLEFASRLADAIDTYVKSATIVYMAGLVAPTGGGAVTGMFNGNLT
jgi:hypothetical protein